MRTYMICGATLAVVAVMVSGLGACSDGGAGITPANGGSGSTASTTAGTNATPGAGTTSTPTAGTSNTGTAGSDSTPGAGTGSLGGSTDPGTGGTSSAGTGTDVGGTGTTAGTSSGGGSGGAPPVGGLRQGPFKILMLTTTLEFSHTDGINECTKMLNALGKADAPERATIAGLAADSTWTVDPIDPDTKKTATYFSEVTAENLAKHEMFYSNNPTGPVFTNAPNGAQKKAIFQTWFENGGAWAGQHSATDFENNSRWTWFNDHVNGGWFTDHDPEPTPGTIAWQSQYVDHPILKGLPSPWNASDEWYIMNRNIETVAGFKVLAKVTVSGSSKPNGNQPRPAIWITENDKGGRAFYTIRGHSGSRYAESQFRQLMLRGILWSVHRLPGGN